MSLVRTKDSTYMVIDDEKVLKLEFINDNMQFIHVII